MACSSAGLTLTSMQLREIEMKVQREINEKRQELLAKEESLRYLLFLVTVVKCFWSYRNAGTWRVVLLLKALRASSESKWFRQTRSHFSAVFCYPGLVRLNTDCAENRSFCFVCGQFQLACTLQPMYTRDCPFSLLSCQAYSMTRFTLRTCLIPIFQSFV